MSRALPLCLLALAACPDAVATTETTGTTGTTGPGASTTDEPSPTGTTVMTTLMPDSSTGAAIDPTTGGINTTTDGEETTLDLTTGEPDPPLTCAPLDGPLAWRWTLDEPGLPGWITAVAVTPTGALVVASMTDPEILDSDARIEVRDPDGQIVWTDTYAGVNGLQDRPIAVAVDPEGFIHVLVSETIVQVTLEDGTLADTHLVVLRYAPDGGHVWRWEMPHEHDQPLNPQYVSGVFGLADDRIHVLEGEGNSPQRLHRLDRFGNLVGEATLALPEQVYPYNLQARTIGPGGEAILAGVYLGRNPDPELWIGRFAADGSPAWNHHFGTDDDHALAILPAPNGDITLIWRHQPMPFQFQRMIRRYDADGDIAWTTSPPDGVVQASSALHCDGSVVLTGYLVGFDDPGSGSEPPHYPWVGRLAHPDGALTTLEQPFGPQRVPGSANHVVAAPDGEVMVLGTYLGPDDVDVPWLGRFGVAR